MRIIAGRFRGMTLEAPAGATTRPMTDRVKETVFNVLGARLDLPGRLPEGPILDLFAGSGALGIEALSRGATACTFVERDRRALGVLRANVAKLRLGDACHVVAENAWTLRLPPAPGAGYVVVFVDPPFRDVAQTTRVLDLLERVATRLAPDGVAVFRHDLPTPFAPVSLRGLRCVDRREIGRNRVLLLAPAVEGGLAREEQKEEEAGPENVGDDADG